MTEHITPTAHRYLVGGSTAARIEQLEAQPAAAENLYRATEFLADNDPDEVVCDGGGTAVMVGLSGIRKALTAYREARK